MTRSSLHDWIPPAVIGWIDSRRRTVVRFEGPVADWNVAIERCTGYGSRGIVEKVLASTIAVKDGAAAFERDSVRFDKLEFDWPVVSGLLWAAARNRGSLNVLDFGGALGSAFFQNRTFLGSLAHVNWNVVEQAHFSKIGTENLKDEQLHFYGTIKECLTENVPNAVLLSGVLQYVEDLELTLNELIAVDADVVIVDRTTVNDSPTHRIYIQHVPPSIYSATYPCRSISERWLLQTMSVRYHLVTEFASLPFPTLAMIRSSFKGYLFSRKGS